MATTFKTFLNDDVASTRTLLHEAIPVTGSILFGTYDETDATETNIKSYTHGMFQSVYDYSYTLSSANHILDLTVGYSSESNNLTTTSDTYKTKKQMIYNEFAKILQGHTTTGAIRQFDEDGNLAGGGDKIKECFVVSIARLLNKDEIKKGSFYMDLDVSSAMPISGSCAGLNSVKASAVFEGQTALAGVSGTTFIITNTDGTKAEFTTSSSLAPSASTALLIGTSGASTTTLATQALHVAFTAAIASSTNTLKATLPSFTAADTAFTLTQSVAGSAGNTTLTGTLVGSGLNIEGVAYSDGVSKFGATTAPAAATATDVLTFADSSMVGDDSFTVNVPLLAGGLGVTATVIGKNTLGGTPPTANEIHVLRGVSDTTDQDNLVLAINGTNLGAKVQYGTGITDGATVGIKGLTAAEGTGFKVTLTTAIGHHGNNIAVTDGQGTTIVDETKLTSNKLTGGASATAGANGGRAILRISDSTAASAFKSNSPAGEYGILNCDSYNFYTISSTCTNDTTTCTIDYKNMTSVTEPKMFADSGTPTAKSLDRTAGLIFYQAGVVVLNPFIFARYLNTNTTGGYSDAGTYDGRLPPSDHATAACQGASPVMSGTNRVDAMLQAESIDACSTAFRKRINKMAFNNTTELNSTIYFCRAGHNDFNYSSNPTYLDSSKIRVKENMSDAPISYITTIGLYAADNELLAVAKLSEPLRKDPTNEMVLRVRLDY